MDQAVGREDRETVRIVIKTLGDEVHEFEVPKDLPVSLLKEKVRVRPSWRANNIFYSIFSFLLHSHSLNFCLVFNINRRRATKTNLPWTGARGRKQFICVQD